jgi:8-oxo-dGTP pyrophosphatase MutT (NUDIX family)
MGRQRRSGQAGKSKVPTQRQVSAGGVAFRRNKGTVRVALIRVGEPSRWQLPKGHLDDDETPEQTAMREVREETGVDCELLGKIGTIDYWFYKTQDGGKVRLHKYVHFFLMKYQSGSIRDHDEEVDEARWVEIEEAIRMLTFKDERRMVAQARGLIRKRMKYPPRISDPAT